MSTSQYLTLKAKKFFNKAHGNFTCMEIEIPIVKKIVDLDVCCTMCVEKIKTNNSTDKKNFSYNFIFKITSNKIKKSSDEYYEFFILQKKYPSIQKNFFDDFILLIKKNATNLSFNNLLGILETQTNEKLTEIELANDCCVCWDKTINKTNCDHFICIECLCKLSPKLYICPYCRNDKIYIKTNHKI